MNFILKILNLAKKLDVEEKYMNEIRNAAFKAMLNTNITREIKLNNFIKYLILSF